MNTAVRKRLTAADITAMTSAANHKVLAPKAPSDIAVKSMIELNVNDVLFYERNPRTLPNDLYNEIKESIRVRGVESALFVTKRPGTDRYMLAKGGKTRLQILQELAKEDPAKWSRHTFEEVPYVKELDVLAAHFVENTGRNAMRFWNFSKGLADIREEMKKEHGKPVSQSEFPQRLAEIGIQVKREDVMNAEFALSHFEEAGEVWQKNLTPDHVRSIFRPDLTALQKLWDLAPDTVSTEFDELKNKAIEACTSTHDYNPELLIDSVILELAPHLGCEAGALSHLLHLHQKGDISTQEDLTTALSQWHASAQAETSETETNSHQEPLHQKLQASTSAPQLAPQEKTVDRGLQNLAKTISTRQQQATDLPGMPGVSVARGLTARPPKSQTGQNQKDLGAPLTQHELALLESMGNVGQARQILSFELHELATTAGIESLVVMTEAHSLPCGFYMELPKSGTLGSVANDLAAQAWWLMASISGQFDHAVVTNLLNEISPEQSLLQDNGPTCFKAAMSNMETFADTVASCLGGEEPFIAELLINILTDRSHELHHASIKVLDACANYREATRQGAQS
jgi:ParB family protein of integrating conjugative element (PFGI_1 class)